MRCTIPFIGYSLTTIAVYFSRQEYEGIISEQRIWLLQDYLIRQEINP